MTFFSQLWSGLLTENPVAGLFGFLGLATAVLLYQQKSYKRLLLCKMASAIFWMLHYSLLGNYSVVVANLVAVIRTVVLLNADKKWAKSQAWLWIFLAVSIGFGIAAWKDWTSILMIFSSLIAIAAYWARSPRINRIAVIPSATLHAINVFFNFSLWGLMTDAFELLSGVVGIIRLDLKRDKGERGGTGSA